MAVATPRSEANTPGLPYRQNPSQNVSNGWRCPLSIDWRRLLPRLLELARLRRSRNVRCNHAVKSSSRSLSGARVPEDCRWIALSHSCASALDDRTTCEHTHLDCRGYYRYKYGFNPLAAKVQTMLQKNPCGQVFVCRRKYGDLLKCLY
jgi:hypothetical protein